jgi:hypothetical protein
VPWARAAEKKESPHHEKFVMANITVDLQATLQSVSVDQIIHVLVVICVTFIFSVIFFGLGGARYIIMLSLLWVET